MDLRRRRLNQYRAVTHVAAHRSRAAKKKTLSVTVSTMQNYTILYNSIIQFDHVIEDSRLDYIIWANIFVIYGLYNLAQDYKQC